MKKVKFRGIYRMTKKDLVTAIHITEKETGAPRSVINVKRYSYQTLAEMLYYRLRNMHKVKGLFDFRGVVDESC